MCHSMICRGRCAGALAMLLVAAAPSEATWSLVLTDVETREVAMGTVTCVANINLLASTPAVVVGRGGAFVQSFSDPEGTRRPVMFEQLMLGTDPEEILRILEGIDGHQRRQYGIADTQGRAVTFSGAQNGAWAGGVTGTIGTMTYAIQGNVLAGPCVVDAMEKAVRGTPGDLPTKLMAAMEVARAAGGDGRCSCSQSDPTACGCPVPEFDKSGHVGGMIVARIGDTDDALCNASGCADGDYFMRLNVAFQDGDDPDPVFQLQGRFDDWRAKHEGRPDAVHSSAAFDPGRIPANGVATATMTVTLRDWRDLPIDAAIASVSVVHAPGSAGLSSIGEISDNGDGTIDVSLTAGTGAGVDRLRVVVDDGVRPVTLMPDPAFEYFELGDIDGNRAVDIGDILAVLASWGPCPVTPAGCPADLDGSGVVDFGDMVIVLGNWSIAGGCCFDDGSCAELSESQCASGGGIFLGEGMTCAGSCPFGACCFADTTCLELPDLRCAILGGYFQGEGTTCQGNACRNDNCDGAIVVGEGSFPFSTLEVTIDEGPDLPAECDEGRGLRFRKDVWFRYVASCDGTATASVCDSDFDTRLAIYDDGDCPGPFLACNDNACGEDGTRSEVSFPVVAGTRYLIRIGARFARGEGTLVIDCAK